ncbi:MAG: PAS domain S-box protein [Desulfuromonadaceae bacterium]|nr:PAS domain S-box protein [Desulfuromonadaceae bacterium]
MAAIEKVKMNKLSPNPWNKGVTAQETFAHNLLEHSAVPTFVIDSRHRVIVWNKACEELTGMKTSEVLGRNNQWKPFYPKKRPVLADIVLEGSKEDLSHLYAKCVRSPLTPDGLQAEGWYESLNGMDRFLIFDAAPVRDNEGKIVAAIQTLRDITARKRAEDSLRTLSQAIEQTPMAIVITDREGTIEYVNPHFTKITGYSKDETIGKNPRIIKSGRQSREFYRELWETILSGNEWHGEFHNKRKNDELYWEDASISPVKNDAGEITHFVGVKEDISERKWAEEELKISHEQVQLLLESTAEAIYGISLLGRCTFANQACARLLGYKHPDELLDKHMHKLIHHKHKDGTPFPPEECRMNSIFRGEGAGCHVDDEVLWRADGTSFDAEYWAYPQRSGNHVVGGVVTFFDITERKRAEEQLHQARLYLSDKNRQLENERTLAHKVLEYILPQQFELPGFTTAIMFRPSDRIGGDFFDAWSDGDCTHFLIGDISGHSTSAALMMAVSKGIFRSLGYTMNDPVEIVTAANRMLCPMMLDSRMFLTLVYVLFDRRDNSLRVVSAGHNPVYHLDGSEIFTIDSTGPAIGWDEEDSWEPVCCRFDPGMLLFLYTDGLTEAKDSAGIEFGDKLLLELREFCSPEALVDGIIEAAEKFRNGAFEDDVTLFAIRREQL